MNKHIGSSIDDHIEEKLNEEEFITYFDRSQIISNISQRIYEMRIKSGLSQKELAEKANTTQPVIARLESGKDNRVPSLDLLDKIAHAVNKKINISFS